jgi:propionyl-CoA synthetase
VGATTLLYEGQPVGTPDAGAFWRVASQHRVTTMFTTPTAARSIRNEDPDGLMLVNHDLSRLRALFLTGERLDLELHSWLTDLLGVPAIDSLLQTETGWPITTSPQGLEKLPTKPGSTSVPMPGYDLNVLDAAGRQQAAGQDGSLVLKLPLPPGCLTTLWNDDKGYVESYLSEFSGYYATGDSGRVDEDGYVFLTGRADNVLNVAGHRLSSGAIEQVISRHPAVAECVVIGVTDPIRGQTPRARVVLKDGVDVDPSDLEAEIVAMVRDQMGPVAALKTVRVLAALPT